MANFCLPKPIADAFRGNLKGDLNPIKLADMSSAERRALFSNYLGEEFATKVNAEFESKLLLKNQQQGMINWIKNITGMKEEVKRDLISRVMKLNKVLNASEEKTFLQDLANKKLGVSVTYEEAKRITELSAKIEEMKANVSTQSGRIAYGNTILDLDDYLQTIGVKKANLLTNIANLPKTAMSTLDLSAPLRQGWGMMSRPQFYKAFGSMMKYAFSEKAFREFKAELITRTSYPLMKPAGLRISVLADRLSQREEQFMSNLLEKVPGVRASERAYVGFLSKLRADTFDMLIEKARLAGEDVSKGSQATKDIANAINDFTGSGNIGKGDRYSGSVPALNAAFFSPRKISATMNMFNPERYVNPNISPTARKAAMRQLIGSIGITSTLLGLGTLFGGRYVTDARNSDFGKLVVGNTRFDLAGGNAQYAVLLARLATNKTVNSTTKKVTELGKGYKPTTRADLGIKFFRNKLSPLASFAASWLYGSDALGNPFNATKEARELVVPLIISDTIENAKEDQEGAFVSTLANMFGVGVQNYDITSR